MATTSPVSTFQVLQTLFPGAIQITAAELAIALRISHDTINNHGKNFYITPIWFGTRKFWRLIDIAAYLDGQLGLAPQAPLEPTPATPATPAVSISVQ